MLHGAEVDCHNACVRILLLPYLPRTMVINLTFSVNHCLDPPTPPTQNNLTLQNWDDTTSMAAWNAAINYTCSAGGHNAFVSNVWNNLYQLTCQENNTFSTPTWPTCVSSMIYKNNRKYFTTFFSSAKYCPSPSDHETEEIKCTTVNLVMWETKLTKRHLSWSGVKNTFRFIPGQSTWMK